MKPCIPTDSSGSEDDESRYDKTAPQPKINQRRKSYDFVVNTYSKRTPQKTGTLTCVSNECGNISRVLILSNMLTIVDRHLFEKEKQDNRTWVLSKESVSILYH